MRWAEVSKINNNMKRPLNEQIRDNRFMGSYLFTTAYDPNNFKSVTFTWTVEKAGYYKVIVVGAPGTTDYASSACRIGGAGGVAIKTFSFAKSSTHTIVFEKETNNTYISTVKFDTDLYATAGTRTSGNTSATQGKGGMGYGGDFNYKGEDGIWWTTTKKHIGASVGVFIPGLSETVTCNSTHFTSTYAYNTGTTATIQETTVESGSGIFGYGASSGINSEAVLAGKDAGCVLIIPLELEEQ